MSDLPNVPLDGSFAPPEPAVSRKPWSRLPATAVTTGFILGAGFLSGVIVARSLGASGRGDWMRSYLTVTVVSWIGTLGVDDALPVLGVRRPGATVMRASRILYLLLGPATALAAAVVLVIGRHPLPVALVVAAYIPAYFLHRLTNGALLLSGQQLRWNVSRALAPASYTLALALLMFTDSASVVHTLYAFTGAEAVAALCSAMLTPKAVRPRLFGRSPIEAEEGEEACSASALLSFGVRLHLGGIFTIINWRVDQLLMTRIAPTRDLGLYTLGSSLSYLPTAVGAGEAESATSQLAAARSVGELRRGVRRLYGRIVLWGGIALVVLGAAAPLLIPVVYGSDFRGAVPATEILLLGSAGLLAGLPAVAGLRAARRPTAVAVSEGVTAVFAIALVPPVFASWGIVGAAWLSTTLYSVKSVAQIVLLARVRRDPRTLTTVDADDNAPVDGSRPSLTTAEA